MEGLCKYWENGEKLSDREYIQHTHGRLTSFRLTIIQCKYTLYVSQCTVSLALSEILFIHRIVWLLTGM